MERNPVIKFDANITDTIWLCQSGIGRAYECRIWPVV